MGIKPFKPTSPARRYYEVADFKKLDGNDAVVKKLTEHQSTTAGRNNQGRITSRFRGGGHKQHYRLIDFKRNKIGVPAKVTGVRTLIMRGHFRRMGRGYEKTRNWKKAIVHVKDGDTIEFFEGA